MSQFLTRLGNVLILMSVTSLWTVHGLSTPQPKQRFVKQQGSSSRRAFFTSVVASTTAIISSSTNPANAIITDETDTFADNWWTTPKSATTTTTTTQQLPSQSLQSNLPSDEVLITINKADLKAAGGLGLELADIEFKTNLRVYVKSIRPDSYASKLGIQKDWIAVALNSQSLERTNAKGVAQYVAQAMQDNNVDSFTLRFRDPSIFREKLSNLQGDEAVTTQVAPAGDTTQRNADGSFRNPVRGETAQSDQRVTVSQIIAPKFCTKGAAVDDLLEISYIGRIVETGQIFDGSAIKIDGQGIAGRGDDVSLYFVLGKQPFGQFPPGWDVGLQGICVGERRRILIPPALAYGSQGLPRRNIPPNATLQYDVTLVSLNGLSTPQ